MLLYGADVSHFQTLADLGRARDFVIVKRSEGERTIDPEGGAFVKAARSRGLLVGHYHFAHPSQDPHVEADHFLSVADPLGGDLVVLDLEAAEGSWATRARYAQAWLERVAARTGAKPLLYVSKSWRSALPSLASWPLWIADYTGTAGRTSVPGWLMHQYTDRPIDLDVFNGDRSTWAAHAVPAPAAGGHGMSAPVHGATLPEAPMAKTLTQDDFDEIADIVHRMALSAEYGTVDGKPYTAAAALRDTVNGVKALQAGFEPAKFAAAVVSHLPSGAVSDAQLEAVVRKVLGSVDDTPVASSGN